MNGDWPFPCSSTRNTVRYYCDNAVAVENIVAIQIGGGYFVLRMKHLLWIKEIAPLDADAIFISIYKRHYLHTVKRDLTYRAFDQKYRAWDRKYSHVRMCGFIPFILVESNLRASSQSLGTLSNIFTTSWKIILRRWRTLEVQQILSTIHY